MQENLRRVFSDIPATYERANRVLTLGLDRGWRRRASERAAAKGGRVWLDACSGTGETAVYLRRLAGPGTTIVACDFCLPMLLRLKTKPRGRGVLPVIGNCLALPFPDESFDLVTISFASRNLNRSREDLLHALREFRRILRPGGWLVHLETSQPRSRAVRHLFRTYVALTVRPLGTLVSGSPAGYRYLSRTIPRFYDADTLAALLREVGFARVAWERMTLGIVAIHEAEK
jgi:demethylmenaquinone methyltransferase/2-methoxy-6-polyprenyl-1,4-benzoquinol methylase